MLVAWARRLFPVTGLIVAAACGMNGSTAPRDDSKPGTGPIGAAVRFDVPGPLTAPSTQAVPLGIVVEGDDLAVTLWLEGEYLDASLGTGELTTKDHRAQIVLQTPSEPASFIVRARTALGSEARLEVTVGSQGLATVTLEPEYEGMRPIAAVFGSIFPKTSCDELAKRPTLEDGTSKTTAELGKQLVIASVPAGTPVAISLRMAHYARGCVDVDRLAPGATKDFASVTLRDRPISLSRATLLASYTFEPPASDAAAYATLLDGATQRAAEAFIGAASPEAGALLDAMKAAAPTASQTTFTKNRNQDAWDTQVTTWLGQHPPGLRTRALGWLTAAKAEARATLGAKLVAAKADDRVTVTPLSWGAVDLTVPAGVTVKAPFEWTAEDYDGVHTSGTFYLLPTAFLTRAADIHAVKDVATATGVATALATQIDCDPLATSLVGTGESFPGCDDTCTANLCRAAFSGMWSLASGASAAANDVVQIAMNVSAHAEVDENAEPLTLDGTWVGKVTSTSGESGMQGSVTGKR